VDDLVEVRRKLARLLRALEYWRRTNKLKVSYSRVN
jgi:hypothetical protein